MRILTVAMAVAVAASGSSAFAQTSKRISDVDFIRANRCASLATATGVAGASSFSNVVERQSRGRDQVVVGMARKASDKAANQVRYGNDERRASLRAELDGACQKFAG